MFQIKIVPSGRGEKLLALMCYFFPREEILVTALELGLFIPEGQSDTFVPQVGTENRGDLAAPDLFGLILPGGKLLTQELE